MKTRIFVLLSLALMLASCTPQKASIEGAVESRSAKQVLLYSYKHGNLKLMEQQEITGAGSFNFELQPEEAGFYLIGSNEDALFPLYVEKGGKMSVKIGRDRLEMGNTSDEANQWLYDWEDQTVAAREHAYLQAYIPQGRTVGYEEFFKELTALSKAQQQYAAKLKDCGDKKLADLLTFKSEADLNFYALSYLKTNGRNLPDSVELCDYYQQMQPDKLFQDLKILDIPYAGQMLDTYVWYLHKDKKLEEGEKFDYTCLKEKDLQQEYLLNAAKSFKFHDEYRELFSELDGEILTPIFEQRMKLIEKDLKWSAPGVSAPDFKGYGPDSAAISLSDFKGKVLVVDVWATWCVPCRRMMPYFVELENEFKNQGVEFLSVCMGVSIERELWLEMLGKQKLPGHHCFIASWTGDFAKNYKVTGVPRYMVFDRQGRIVSVNAPKPNKPGLKEMILHTLNDKK